VDREKGKRTRELKRVAIGMWVAGAALCFMGAISLASSYAHLIESVSGSGFGDAAFAPRFAWALYAGIPLLAAGTVMRFYLRFWRR
jgi:hypothetical protein